MRAAPPDVTARLLPEAVADLAREGWEVDRVVETGPPRAGTGRGTPRVARIRVTGEGRVELAVVCTEYEERDAAE